MRRVWITAVIILTTLAVFASMGTVALADSGSALKQAATPVVVDEKTSESVQLPIDISAAKIARIATCTYTGKYIKPRPVVWLGAKKLKRNRDYILVYRANRNAGKAKVVVCGIGNYRGKAFQRFTIKQAPMTSVAVEKVANQIYTGELIKPRPAVYLGTAKLKRNRDYLLAFKKNRRVGYAQIVVRGIGNFRGSKVVPFKIVEWVTNLKVAKKTRQLIIVQVVGTQATVTAHVKSGGFWREVVGTDEGWIGSNGLGKVREGSRRTPRGVLYPDMAFGIQEDPGCKMGYTQADWSDYWCCDPESDLYNQWVSINDRSDFDLGVSENILSCGHAYNYCLNMGWNKECTPYRGSAFFLHCSTGGPTAGCVGIPEWAMIEVLRCVQPGCIMVIDTPDRITLY